MSDGRRCGLATDAWNQDSVMAPDSMCRPLKEPSRCCFTSTFPADHRRRHCLWWFPPTPALAVGVVFALGAAPRWIREKMLGLDGGRDLMDETSRPAEILDAPRGLESLEPRLCGLEQHVESEL